MREVSPLNPPPYQVPERWRPRTHQFPIVLPILAWPSILRHDQLQIRSIAVTAKNGVDPHHPTHQQGAYASSPIWTSVLALDRATRPTSTTSCHLGKLTSPLVLHASYDVPHDVVGNRENGLDLHHPTHQHCAHAFSQMWMTVLSINRATRRTSCHLGKSTSPLALHALYDENHVVVGNRENGLDPHHPMHQHRAHAFSQMWTTYLSINRATRRTR